MTSRKRADGESTSTARSGGPGKKPSISSPTGMRSARTNQASGARTVSGSERSRKPASDEPQSPRPRSSTKAKSRVMSRPPMRPGVYDDGLMQTSIPRLSSYEWPSSGSAASSSAVIKRGAGAVAMVSVTGDRGYRQCRRYVASGSIAGLRTRSSVPWYGNRARRAAGCTIDMARSHLMRSAPAACGSAGAVYSIRCRARRPRRGVPMTTHEARNVSLVGHSDLDGWGDAFQVTVREGIAYVAASGDSGHEGTTILDARDPARPAVIARMPAPEGTHSHKTQLLDQHLIVNHEQRRGYEGDAFRPGIRIVDVSDPAGPRDAAFFTTAGRGVHRPIVDAARRRAYLSTRDDEAQGQVLWIVDLADPLRPALLGRWWHEG